MSQKSHYWVGYADIMTLLMVVFLLISLSFMALLEEKDRNRKQLVSEYQDIRNNIYKELVEEFKEEAKDWDIEISPDLSIRFTNPQVLFEAGSSELTFQFRKVLYLFIPRYYNILLQKQYVGSISEIRIEGHTDTTYIFGAGDSYMNNMDLSQARARSVLQYIRELDYFKRLSNAEKNKLTFLTTANGLSFGRTLDNYKQPTFVSGLQVNNTFSRRVEFKVLTKSDDLIRKLQKLQSVP